MIRTPVANKYRPHTELLYVLHPAFSALLLSRLKMTFNYDSICPKIFKCDKVDFIVLKTDDRHRSVANSDNDGKGHNTGRNAPAEKMINL